MDTPTHSPVRSPPLFTVQLEGAEYPVYDADVEEKVAPTYLAPEEDPELEAKLAESYRASQENIQAIARSYLTRKAKEEMLYKATLERADEEFRREMREQDLKMKKIEAEYLQQLYQQVVGKTTSHGPGYVHIFNVGTPGPFYTIRLASIFRTPKGISYITGKRIFGQKEINKVYRTIERAALLKRPLILIRTIDPITRRYAYLFRPL